MLPCAPGWSASLTSSDGAAPRRGLARLIAAEPAEVPAVAGGFALFFLLFASYFMLRPVRETFAIAGGVDNLQWLFTATFIATLIVVPLFGWVSRRVSRRRLLPATYGFSAVVMIGFAASLLASPENVWIGRAFYVWLSVFNLFVISIAWSLMADIFRTDQAHRLFGQIAAGASLGGLAGPLLSTVLVAPLGHAGLLLLSTALLLSTLACVGFLVRWSDRQPHGRAPETWQRPIGGNVWAGLGLILRTPYLLAISAFVLLLTVVSTFLYLEQARIMAEVFPDPVRQTQVFGTIDAVVQALTIGVQVFLTGHVARRLGVRTLLCTVPLLMVLGFGLLAVATSFPVFVAVMILRRVGEYAFVRPGREMLFAPVDRETKYKAKNAIDTVVYRAGDLLGAWTNTAVLFIGPPAAVMGAGAAVAAMWGVVGYAIGRRHDREGHGAISRARAASGPPASSTA
jgi:AAA family ATP:ADP antiporter